MRMPGTRFVLLSWIITRKLFLLTSRRYNLQYTDWIAKSEFTFAEKAVIDFWRANIRREDLSKLFLQIFTIRNCGKPAAIGRTTKKTCFPLKLKRKSLPWNPWIVLAIAWYSNIENVRTENYRFEWQTLVFCIEMNIRALWLDWPGSGDSSKTMRIFSVLLPR